MSDEVKNAEEEAMNVIADIQIPVLNALRCTTATQLYKALSHCYNNTNALLERAVCLALLTDYVSCACTSYGFYTEFQRTYTQYGCIKMVSSIFTKLYDEWITIFKGSYFSEFTENQSKYILNTLETAVKRLPINFEHKNKMEVLLKMALSNYESCQHLQQQSAVEESSVLRTKNDNANNIMSVRNKRPIEKADNLTQNKKVFCSEQNQTINFNSNLQNNIDDYHLHEEKKKIRNDITRYTVPSKKEVSNHTLFDKNIKNKTDHAKCSYIEVLQPTQTAVQDKVKTKLNAFDILMKRVKKSYPS